MQASISSLMALLLLANAAFGCCRHRAHECALAEAPAAAGCCCHCQPDEPGQGDLPCNCEFECHGTCTFLPPQKSDGDAATRAASADLVCLLEPLLVAERDRTAWHLSFLPTTGNSPPVVRLYLLHQNLLV